jgi:hypothetical protein
MVKVYLGVVLKTKQSCISKSLCQCGFRDHDKGVHTLTTKSKVMSGMTAPLVIPIRHVPSSKTAKRLFVVLRSYLLAE